MKLKSFIGTFTAVAACGVAAFVGMRPVVKSAQAAERPNLLAEEDTVAGPGVHVHQAADAFSFTPATLGGDAKCDERTMHILQNSKINAPFVIKDGIKTPTSVLDVTYQTTFTYAAITTATYNHVGIIVGRDANGVYKSIQLEIYKSGSSEHRGFLFTGSSDADGTTPFYTTPIVTEDYEVGNGFSMKISKVGNSYTTFINGEEIASVTMEDLIPCFGLYIFGTYTTYSESSYVYEADGITDYVNASPLDEARANTNFVIDSGFEFESNLRGWGDVAYNNENGIGFGTNDGKDVREFTNINLTDGQIDGKAVDLATLDTYYGAKIKYVSRTNDNGALGLLIGKKGANYATVVLEANRGHSYFYTFDSPTTTEANTAEGYLFEHGAKNPLAENDEILLEILKSGDKFNIYVDGNAVIENFTGSLAETTLLDGLVPTFGIASNFCEASYTELTFKVLNKGFKLPEKNPELIAARESSHCVVNSGFTFGSNVRGWSDVAYNNENGMGFGTNDGKDVRMFGNVNPDLYRVDGAEVDASTLTAYYSADIKYVGRSNDNGAIGLLIGRKAIDGGTKYVSLVIEANRGHAIFYEFDVDGTGGTTRESNIEGYLFEHGAHNPLTADQTIRLEMIKTVDSFNIYVNGTVVIKEFTGSLDSAANLLDDLEPIFGITSNFVEAQYSNLTFKLLDEGASIADAELEAARAFDSRNLLNDDETIVGPGVHKNNTSEGFGGDRYDFDPSTMSGNAWCDERSMHLLKNYEINKKNVVIDDVVTPTSEVNAYYRAEFGYAQLTERDYNHVGIMVGRDSDGVYKSIQLEVYKAGSQSHRGFLFTGSSNEDGINPFYTTTIITEDYEVGNTWVMEIIKNGDEYKTYINGKYYASTTLEDLTPVFGVYTYATYATFEDVEFKYLVNYTPYTPSTDATASDIKVKGETIPGFNKDVLVYEFEEEEEDWPTSASDVEVTVTDTEHATSKVEVEEGVVTIEITAEDESTLTYVISYSVPKSEDNTLKSLKIKGTSITIADVMSYTAPAHVKSLAVADVEAVTNDSKATSQVSVNGSVVTIVVTAENGDEKTYTVNVTWNLSSDATLSMIKILDKEVSGFDPQKTEYEVTVSKAITGADVDATCSDEYANLSIVVSDGVVTITVTAENGATKVYTVVTKVSAPKTGCGGSVIATSVILSTLALAGAGAIILKKKKEEK